MTGAENVSVVDAPLRGRAFALARRDALACIPLATREIAKLQIHPKACMTDMQAMETTALFSMHIYSELVSCEYEDGAG